MSAHREVGGGASCQSESVSRDLRLGRLEVFHTLAVDLSELVRDNSDRATLQRLRAKDDVWDRLHRSLVGNVAGWEEYRDRIEERARKAVHLKGKAVWTDYFLDRYAPLRLNISDGLVRGDETVEKNNRLSNEVGSALHHMRYGSGEIKLFRDGTLTYTMRVVMDDRPRTVPRGSRVKPATVGEVIARLDSLGEVLTENFSISVGRLILRDDFREAVEHGLGLNLLPKSQATRERLIWRVREHRVLFVEEFFDGEEIDRQFEAGDVEGGDAELGSAAVELGEVLASRALAGILNAASWYEKYDGGYVGRLAARNIGYRNDEIYLTDRKATVIASRGIWKSEARNGEDAADPLSLYKWDIVLAVEYNVARLAYCLSTQRYYQEHPDVVGFDAADADSALRHVIDGRAVVAHIEESLDLNLLIDHGFTRLFVSRLRGENGLVSLVDFVRGRVEDLSTGVALKSSVLAAEHTGRDSLRAAMANNTIQRVILLVATLGVVVTLVTYYLAQ